jgi:hypothetical protein
MNATIVPALAALAAFPYLPAPVERSAAAQARRIAERMSHFVSRPALQKTLDERIRAAQSGLLVLEGPPGSGTTTMLCHLAASRPYAFWFPDAAAGAGLEALCAQLLALYDLPIKLVPPAAGRDATALERILAEAGSSRPHGDPLVVLIDRPPGEQATPLAPPFPTFIPPGVVIVLASSPGVALPLRPAARVTLPTKGARLDQRLALVAIRLGVTPQAAPGLAEHSRSSFLYVWLAAGLIRSGSLDTAALPVGLEALHQFWWRQLDDLGRRLACLVAAAGAPLDLALLTELSGAPASEVRRWIKRWRGLLEVVDRGVRLYHSVTHEFVMAHAGDALASAHAAYVVAARARSGGQLERLREADDGYLVQEVARHIALSDPITRAGSIEAPATRAWAAARERVSGSMYGAAQDLAWLLRAPVQEGETLRLVRHATLGGILTLLGRTLPPDAPAGAFDAAVAAGGARDATLKRVREMLDQLPDTSDKAQALRRLGEVCYALRMRASAMRMLSEALDFETPGPSRAWRDEREETLVALARAAIAIDHPDTALGITARIGHAERRGMVETEVVRWMLAHEQRTRAEEVAYAIGHVAMHEWAMAEVAVGHARGGDAARGETVLSTLKTETAIAWARGELACDAARAGDPHAPSRLAPITTTSLCDRALALVALALVVGKQPDAALDTLQLVEDGVVRAQALVDLALLQPPNTAVALSSAASTIAGLADDDRAPLLAGLAAAQATVERLEVALRTVALLTEDEERDRAQSRVAVALARRGNDADARIVADAIDDDDERDWAFDELARMATTRGEWDAAFGLAAQIVDAAQRARTEADVVIAWGRAGEAAAAQARVERIESPSERLRVYTTLAGPLVVQRAVTTAQEIRELLHDPEQHSRYGAALAAALAASGDLAAAHAAVGGLARPIDRARALVALAQAAGAVDRPLAHSALGEALRTAAALGRAETLKCLEWAAGTLAQLGGVELLLAVASALDEIDSWWGG